MQLRYGLNGYLGFPLSAILVATVTIVVFAVLSGDKIPAQWSQGEFRTIDGMGNHLLNPKFGSAGIQLLRMADTNYSDGVFEPGGPSRKAAR